MTTLERALSWRLQTPFFYGWLVLFTAALGTFAATSVAGVVFGGIQGLISEEMNWTRSTIGLTATAGVWASGLLAPFIGQLADRYGPRWLMPIGTIVLGLCLYTLGGISSVWQFFLVAVLARAVSQPLLIGVVPRTMAVNFFQRRRNLALALTGMFRPITSAVNIQIILAIAVTRGWRTAFQYLGIVSLLLTLPLALVVRRRPEDISLLPDGANPQGPSPDRPARNGFGASLGAGRQETSTEGGGLEYGWTAREAFHTRTFWMVSLAIFLGVAASSGIGFSMVPYLNEAAHLSTPQAAGVLSVSTLLSLSNLGWGYLADRFTPRRCILGAMVCATFTMFFLFSVSNLASAYVFGVMWGVFSAATDVLISMLVAQYFGRRSFGSILGTLRPFEAGGLGVGQSLGPIIYDVFGNYRWLIVTAIAAHLLAALLVLLARPPAPPRDPRLNRGDPETPQ